MPIFPENYSGNHSGMIKIEIVAKGFPGRKRLEDFLFDRLPHFTRSQIRKAIREFGCEVNGWPANRGTPVRQNDFIEFYSDHATASFIFPKKGKIKPIYEDHEILVINKPSGVLVHPSHRDKTGTLLETVYYHINRDLFCENQFFSSGRIANHRSAMPSSEKIGLENFHTISLDDDAELKSYKRPGLVHRLDLDTSGVLLIAKTKRAHRKLSLQFQQRKVIKKYLAVVDGTIEAEEGEFRFPIIRDAAKKMWIVSENGKPSLTRFKVLERSPAL
ncbi:MAG TPA: RluA family pseudouridine synthase, partial [Pyrinomonadaceae bacterium]|nr:RluA family pseudouridine synthase [Pyrinomonadaceae bacterium]